MVRTTSRASAKRVSARACRLTYVRSAAGVERESVPRRRIARAAARYRGFLGWVIVFIVFIFLLDGFVMRPLQRKAFRWRDGDVRDGAELFAEEVGGATGL